MARSGHEAVGVRRFAAMSGWLTTRSQ